MSIAQEMNLPAAFTQRGASPKMSDRYVNICTADIIDAMAIQGFELSSYSIDKCYRTAPEFARHLCVFRHPELQGHTAEYMPQILFMNSHNGKSPADWRFGAYRFACANGLVIGTDLLRVKVKHMGTAQEIVREQIGMFQENQNKVVQTIENWSAIELSKPEVLEFTQKAVEIRFGDKGGMFAPESFLEVKRADDDGATLWQVFNRLQENMTKGGQKGKNANNRQVSSKALDAIGGNLAFNNGLWNLAGEVAKRHAPVVIDVQSRVIGTV